MFAFSDSIRSTGKAAWRRLYACLLFMLVGIISISAGTFARERHARVVVVIANYLSLEDLQSAGPNTRSLIDTGAIGLINTGTRWKASPEVQYIAVGSGVRVFGSDGQSANYESTEMVGSESASQAYTFQTGRIAQENSAVCLNLSRLLSSNRKTKGVVENIGLVGTAFHKAGLKTAVIGSGDAPPKLRRDAALIAMDEHGFVDTGAIGSEALIANESVPFGLTDNLAKMMPLAKRLMADHALVVMELGDFARLEESRDFITEKAYQQNRVRCLQNLDRALGIISSDVRGQGATLIVCSPCRAQSISGYRSNLSPIIVWKHGGIAGLLSTPTTRMDGILNNTDVAPTILRAANLPVPESLIARAAEPVAVVNTVERLQRIERIGTRSYALQIPVLACIGILAIFAVTASEIVIRRYRNRAGCRKKLRLLLLVIISMPAALLIADSTNGPEAWRYVLNLILSVCGILGAVHIMALAIAKVTRGRVYSPIAALMFMTALLIAVDALTGTRMLRCSILSCDQITGIRFYGIGNEYMGILVGMSLLAPVLFLRSWANSMKSRAVMKPFALILTGIWFAFITLIIGHPGIGANVGGLLMSIATFGSALIILSGSKLNIRHGLIMVAGIILSLSVFAIVDILNMGVNGSHLGRAISLTYSQGWSFPVGIIAGKIGMHLRLIATPQAIYPMVFGIPFLVLYFRREKAERLAAIKFDLIRHALIPVIIVGIAVGFFFKDSGIVPASLLLMLYLISVLYSRLEEIKI